MVEYIKYERTMIKVVHTITFNESEYEQLMQGKSIWTVINHENINIKKV